MYNLYIMREFEELISIVKRLRSKKGCPWDRAQTHKSLRPFAIEEAYELVNAIDEGDPDEIKQELGDLLLQVMLHSRIAEEKGRFTLKDVVRSISEKMVRRHPHVFGTKSARNTDEVWKNWEEIKKTERSAGRLLDSIPKALPALYRAEKTQKKAARVGFDWDNVAGAWEKVEEELGEIFELIAPVKGTKKKLAQSVKGRLREEIGDLLFAVVNVARKMDIDSEDALHEATKKFTRRFGYVENAADRSKKRLADMDLKEMDALWNRAKKSTKR